MSGPSPRTDAPSDRFGEDYPRFSGHVDAGHTECPAAPCPDCGTPDYDLWLRHGAAFGRLVCVGCGAAPYVTSLDGEVERVDGGEGSA